jgi:hypothetical protein
LLQHRWLNRLQTGLLVLTLVGIAAAAGSLLFGKAACGSRCLPLQARCCWNRQPRRR